MNHQRNQLGRLPRSVALAAVHAILLFALPGGIVHAAATLDISPASSPVIVESATATSFYFNLTVSDDGLPASLPANETVDVDLPQLIDTEYNLTLLPAQTQWLLAQGFEGGLRELQTSVIGSPPDETVELTAPISFTLSDSSVINADLTILVRPGPVEHGWADFCFQPGDGWRSGTGPALGTPPFVAGFAYNDFGPIMAIGSVVFEDAAAATIADNVRFEVHEEMSDGRFTTAPVDVDEHWLQVIDHFNDGIADAVHFGVRLERTAELALAEGEHRILELRAYRDDDANALIRIALLELRSRVTTWVDSPVLGFEEPVTFEFRLQQSHPLTATPKLFRNDVELPEAAQALAALEPHSSNSTPTASGLYDLSWKVVVNFALLAPLAGFVVDDELRVDLHFDDTSVEPLSAPTDVLQAGVNATVFSDMEELEGKEFDNDKTELDYVRDLIEALCEAGLEVDDEGGLSFPGSPFDDGEDEDLGPNWQEVCKTLIAIREALMAYKNAERKSGGQDCMRRRWRVRATVQVGDKEIPVVILIRTDGRTAVASDGGDDGTLVIVFGTCGEDAQGSQDGQRGGKAKAELEGKGSLGIALGGNGGEGGEGSDARNGGNGGDAEVDVSGIGSTGIALGGKGGSTEGAGRSAGNGGNGTATSERGRRADLIAEGGASGSQRFPPSNARTSTGEARVTNPDSTPDHRGDGGRRTSERRSGTARLNNGSGRTTGPVARGTPDRDMDSDEGRTIRDGPPVTGD
jgi:hypothetical protein